MFRIESYITSIILSYVEKYVKNLRRQDAQVSLWDGEGLFQNLELDLDVLEKELNLPFIVLSGHINQLLIRVPWTKLGSEPVKIIIDTIECVLKLKTPQQKKAKKNDKSYRASTDYDELPPPSYVQSLINKIIGNLSITCNNVILKYIEDDIVLSMNIKSITLDSCNENWNPDIIELTPTQLILRKIINLSDVTICLDRRNASGCIETYLEPLLYKCSLSIRLCRMFRSLHSARPYATQIDMFCSKIAFIITEPQLPMFLRLLTMILELNQTDISETNNSIDEYNRSPSSCSSISESNLTNNDGWVDWIWSWVPSVNLTTEFNEVPLSPDTVVSGHTLNTGIYIDTLYIILKIKSTKKLNDYRPLLQITFSGSFIEIVSHPSDWINVQLGISKINIESLGDCTCNAQDCYTNTYYMSGGLRNTYLSKSLFQENININYHNNLFLIEHHLSKYSETILLEKTPAFAIDYLFTLMSNSYQNNCDNENESYSIEPEEKHLLRFVGGPSILNVTSGLIHRIEFIYKLILENDLLSFTGPTQSSQSEIEEKFNTLINSSVQMMVYQFTIFNPMIKVFPACHVPTPSSQRHKKNQKSCLKQFDPVFENPPTVIFELKVLDGRIMIPKKKTMWSILPQNIIQHIIEEKKVLLKTNTVIRVKDLVVNIALPNSIHNLLKINNIKFNTVVDCILNYNSDCILDIDFVSFTTSKENCLLMYYIIHSIIMSNHRKLLHVNNYIFKSSLLDDAPGTIVLKINLEGAKLNYKIHNQISCIKILFNNVNSKIIMYNKLNENILSAVLFSTPEFIKNAVPFLQVILQLPCQINENAMPLMYLKIGRLDMNFDPMLFDWLVYTPDLNKHKEMRKKMSTSDLAFFSAPSRKISETSISSDKKKKHPKPSIHSSVSENISFHSANYMHLKNESKEMKIVHLFNKLKSLIIFINTSKVILHFPNKSLSMLKKSSSCKNVDLNELLEISANNGTELLVIKISNISLKCVMGKNEIEQYLHMTPICFPNTLWSSDSVYFPWQLNFHKLECYTIYNSNNIAYQRSYTRKMQLLYPFSAQCTLAITTQFHNNIQSLKSLAACIHCDSDPISICITEQQVRIIADLLKKVIEVYKIIFASIEYGTLFSRSVAHEMSSIPEDDLVETKTCEFVVKKTEEHIKLSGWFQWTLARFSLIIKNNPEQSSLKNIKLVLNLEDVISSLDFGLAYQKLKLKISSASIQHFIKNIKEEQWRNGSHLGIILKGYDPLNTTEKTSKTDGFLNFTLTRAVKSSFQGFKLNKDNIPLHMVDDEMIKLNQQLMDEYIMEIVIKVQPIDIVISPLNLHKFLSIIDPLLEIFINSKYLLSSSNSHKLLLEPASNELLRSMLPLFYLDIALLRIFIPISMEDNIKNQDTAIIQVNSIKINQNPEYPITRTPIRKDLYTEAERKGLLTIPGSIIEDRQYQIAINKFSIKTGFWIDLKQVLKCYQELSTFDNDHQPNAALLWNEGKRPMAIGNSNLDEMNTSILFNEVSFHLIFAPAIIFEPENILVCGSWVEVNTLNEITITLSVEQLSLLNTLIFQCNEYILSHLKTNYIHVKHGEPPELKHITDSLTQDSGIHSTEDYSKFFDHEYGSTSLVENKINFQSNNALFIKKETNAIYKIPIDIIITGNQINFNFFNFTVKKDIKISEPLVFAVIHQPHIFFSLSSTSDSCQIIIYDLMISLAPKNNTYKIEIPDSKIYSIPLFETKSNTMDEIPLAFFTLKMSCPISVGQYKVELNIGRAISLLLDKQKIDHCYNFLDLVIKIIHAVSLPNDETKDYKNSNSNIDSKFDDFEILNQSFKIDPVVSQYDNDEFDIIKYDNSIIDSTENRNIISEIVDESIIEIPTLNNEHCWYSKPIIINLITQQIFLQLFTERKDNIVVSIENIFSKLNSLWKKPSERMNGEITLNSATISIGNSNSNSNELLLHPWTMTLDISLSSDPWVPEHFRPTKQLKILTDYISFNISPNQYNTLKLMWDEYKYLFKYNKNTTKHVIQNSELDDQFYQDDLRAGAFQFIENNNSELPLPYQIFFSEYVSNNPPNITWRYPQPRTLTKIEIQPVPIDADVDIKLHLQWYDEIQNCFREDTCFVFPKYEPMLLRIKSWQAVSNTWRIIMDNSCVMPSPLQRV